ncbi:hypothetical protein DYH55_02400 [Methylovirgula sp. 4M-Z18]|nr:hypothetical protein DYH55_02400 [Methylovirgula sp. 4M-Z18]
MEVVPDDMNNLQQYASDSLDHVVGDTITSVPAYSGFAAVKSGPAQLTVAAGRIYNAGKVYALGQSTSYDFTSILPVAAKKIVIISGWGSESDTNVTQRNFLIPATSTPQAPQYKPQPVALTHARIANLGQSTGTESPDPQAPVIDPTLLPIVQVLLTPTGISSVTMLAANQVPSLQDVDNRLETIEAWEAGAAPQLVSLSSDVQRLSNDARQKTGSNLTGRMLARIAVLESKNGIPSNAADSSADFFLDTTSSDLTNPLMNALTREGIRFADNGAADAALGLFNPLNPLATVAGGVLLPAYDPSLRLSVGPQTGQIQLSSYSYATSTLVQKTMSRVRVRYGTEFTVCTNSAYWQSGKYDPITGIFTLPNGDVFKAAFDLTNGVYSANSGGLSHVAVRLQQFWTDTVSDPYWDRITVTNQISGTQVAETFPVGQDMWLQSIGLFFTKIDAQGSVNVVICQATSTGLPDLTQVIAQASLDQPHLQLAPAETNFAFATPVYLQAGKRYAVVVMTGANHFVASADGTAFPGGTFFTVVGGAYAQGDLTKHLAFNLYTCKFRQAISTIDLNPLQLAGGITSLDILAGAITPGATSLTFEVQVNGQWISLAAANAGALNAGGSLPPLLPLHAVFAGTPDVQPVLNLLQSNVHVSRPNTSFTHMALPRTPPAATSSIRIIERYESFDPNFHTGKVTIMTGAGYATETQPSSYSDVIASDGATERTFVFNLGAAVTSWVTKSAGTTTSALKTFHVAWRKDWVL